MSVARSLVGSAEDDGSQDQVPRRTDGQELGDALDDGQGEDVQQCHCARPFAMGAAPAGAGHARQRGEIGATRYTMPFEVWNAPNLNRKTVERSDLLPF